MPMKFARMPLTRKPPRPQISVMIAVLPGYYVLRLVPKGWEVPCALHREDDRFKVEIDETMIPTAWTIGELEEFWPPRSLSDGNPVLRVAYYGRPCNLTEYLYRVGYKKWAREHQPDHPCLQPTVPIKQSHLPPNDF